MLFLEQDDEDADEAKERAHQTEFIFFELTQTDSFHSAEREPGEDDHAGDGGDGKNGGEQSEAHPTVANAGNVDRQKSFAGRKGEQGKQASDCYSI